MSIKNRTHTKDMMSYENDTATVTKIEHIKDQHNVSIRESLGKGMGKAGSKGKSGIKVAEEIEKAQRQG